MSAWYEQSGPTKAEAISDAKNSLKNEDIPEYVIEKCVQAEIDTYGGLGSYRGYAIFTRQTILQRIKQMIKTRKEKISIIEKNPHFQRWMNYVLYRPPDESLGHKPLRYLDAFNSFSKKSNLM
tara:strand:- start:202 stop:570 length:369 start_codon:yes stop_codon:yes gene_type:complete